MTYPRGRNATGVAMSIRARQDTQPSEPGWWLASDGKWYPPETAPSAQMQQPTSPSTSWSSTEATATKKKRWPWVVLVVVVLFVAGIASCAALVGSAANNAGKAIDRTLNHAHPNGITLAEFNQLTPGMTRAQAESIVGHPGTIVSTVTTPAIPDLNEPAHTTIIVQWDGVALGANANATFQDDHLTAKAQFGLR